ncbi:MAG: MBL fold metallo-hydrolase [Lachnospiraceae bacterium]|nr:MBL fold metallo-hydrolase [Lachnospiraceae bacterium]
MEKLRDLDAAMVPVGGYFTIDARQAADIIHSLKPGTVIPMHYRSDKDGFGYDVIGTVAEFTEIMDNVRTISGSEIEIEALNTPGTQVVVLQPENKA